MIKKIKGTLEIDVERGVVYFHADELQSYGLTPLRIQGLITPIDIRRMIDLNLAGQSQFTAQETIASIIASIRAAEIIGVEFGYKCCEDGLSIQAAILKALEARK